MTDCYINPLIYMLYNLSGKFDPFKGMDFLPSKIIDISSLQKED